MSSEELRKILEEKNERIGLIVLDHFDQFLRDNGFEGHYIATYGPDPPRLQYRGIAQKNKDRIIDIEWYFGYINVWISRKFIKPATFGKRLLLGTYSFVIVVLILIAWLILTPFFMLAALVKYIRQQHYGHGPAPYKFSNGKSILRAQEYITVTEVDHLMGKGDLNAQFITHNEEKAIRAHRTVMESNMLPIIRGEKWPDLKLTLAALKERLLSLGGRS